MDKIWWIVIIIFAVAFLWWMYMDGKMNPLTDRKIKDYRASEILTILYMMLIIFSVVTSFIHLLL
ncbi:MAG TPA: hypothetical protein VKO67_00195 [Smithellaceae bacterium]|nr:hypothetical protein [Smithellaceae bacterium]